MFKKSPSYLAMVTMYRRDFQQEACAEVHQCCLFLVYFDSLDLCWVFPEVSAMFSPSLYRTPSREAVECAQRKAERCLRALCGGIRWKACFPRDIHLFGVTAVRTDASMTEGVVFTSTNKTTRVLPTMIMSCCLSRLSA